MIVVDANILIRAVLGRRVRQLVEIYAAQGVRFFAPDIAFDDARKYLPPLLKKGGRSDADVAASLEYLRHLIEPVERDLYATFEKEARQRLCGRDESDWPVLAAALGLACATWTEDADSRVRILTAAWADCRGLLRLRRDLARGRYAHLRRATATQRAEARPWPGRAQTLSQRQTDPDPSRLPGPQSSGPNRASGAEGSL